MRDKKLLRIKGSDLGSFIAKSPKLLVGILLCLLLISTVSVLAYLGAFSNAAPGSLTVTIDQKSGTTDPNPSYTSVFTTTFSNPIDSSTFTDADITLGGTAPSQTVQSITEAGSFNKTTYEVRIQANSAGTITPSISQELVTAQDSGTHGTNQASTSTDNTVTYNGDYAPNEFVMRVKTDNAGQTGSNQFRIPTTGGGYNYSVDWGDSNTSTGQTGNSTHTYAGTGTYTVKVTGNFPRIYVDSSGDRAKILTIEQWGSNPWISMQNAFAGAYNLQIPALDTPDLQSVTTLQAMFYNASSFNSNINHWDVSSVTDMTYLFYGNTAFNQPLSSWNVSSVNNMFDTFWYATSFNQPLNNWDVSSVVTMSNMFFNATSFNQPLNSWNVSSVVNMYGTFGWTPFNQPLNNWDVSNVGDMSYMFVGATEFNQSLASWGIGSVTTMSNMFSSGSKLSITNYDATLIGWSAQSLQSNVPFNAGTSKYCNAETQHESIINTFNWTINDGGKQCPPPDVTTEPATNVDQGSATLHGTTTPVGVTQRGFQYGTDTNYGSSVQDTSSLYSYASKWGTNGSGDGQLNSPTDLDFSPDNHVYVVDQSNYRIQKFDSNGNFITKWGTNGSGDGEFTTVTSIAVAGNNEIYVSDTAGHRIQKFDSNGNFITKWGTNGSGDGEFSYPQGIAVDTSGNVYIADNQNNRIQKFDSNGNFITKWGTNGSGDGEFSYPGEVALDSGDNVYVADTANHRIQKFDSNGNFITKWGTNGSGDGEFSYPYGVAIDASDNLLIVDNYNHRIQKFDSNGNFITRFGTGPSFGDGAFYFPRGVAISPADGKVYVADSSNSRIQVFTSGSITANVIGLACNTTHHYRAYATNVNGTGYGEDETFITDACQGGGGGGDPFIMRVKTDNPGQSNSNQFRIPTNTTDYSYSYNVDCNNDGTDEYTNQTGNVTCTYGSPGEYDIAIHGTFPHMNDGYVNDPQKIIDVKQWGDIEWQDMSYMFYGASNLSVFTATDTPELSQVLDMSYMFGGATNFNSNINSWDVSGVMFMVDMFGHTNLFNQPLNNWDTGSVTDMEGMFSFASSFNQPLNNWDTGSVTSMGGTFAGASSFNQPLNNWNVENVTEMSLMFAFTTSFDQPLNNWDTSSLESVSQMFMLATSFNQPLNNWDTSNLTELDGMFVNATSFDQSLADWDVSNFVAMPFMFGDMFEAYKAAFEQYFARPYDQWTQSEKDEFYEQISEVLGQTVDETYIPSPSGLSTSNYDATLISWSQQDLQEDVPFDAGSSKYCTSETQRQSMIDDFTWTINDSGKDCTPPLGVPSLTGVAHSTSVELDWSDVVGADHYIVQYKTATSNTWTTYTDNIVTGSYLEVSNLTSSTSYNFRVRAVDSESNQSSWSNTLTISTLSLQVYHITDCQQLQSIAINPITLEFGNTTASYILDNDIDCSESENWVWEGLMPPEYQSLMGGFIAIQDIDGGQPFTGTFDGQGHTISNMYQKAIAGGGLFGQTQGSELKDVIIENSNISDLVGAPFNGGFAGRVTDTTISNVQVKQLDLSSIRSFSGGLVGAAIGDVSISKSSAEGIIQTQNAPTGTDTVVSGGLVGVAGYGADPISIERSYADVDISVTVTDHGWSAGMMVGGLVGGSELGYGELNNTYSHGSIDIDIVNEIDSNGVFVGGLAGTSVEVDKSYSATPITLKSNGIVGHDDTGVGGLIGSTWAPVVNSFAVGAINTIGAIHTDDPLLTPAGLVGQIIGSPESIEEFYFNNYYDQTKTGASSCVNRFMDADDNTDITPTPTIDCHPVNTSNSQPNYFINNHTNPPLNQWNFSNIWVAHEDKYPDFVADTIVTPPTPTAPSAPRNLSISNRTKSSLKLNWQPPASNGGSPITGYRVQYKASSSNDWLTAPTQGASPRSRTFTGLTPDTSYDFRVTARNTIGFGPYSSPVTGKTLAESTNPPNPDPPVVDPKPDPKPTDSSTSTTDPDTDTDIVVPGANIVTPTTESPSTPNAFVRGSLTGFLVELARKVPSPVALYIPFSILALLLALAGFYTYSVLLERHRRALLTKLLTRIKSTTSARRTYLQLTSHYINTPIAKMQGVVELLSMGVAGSSATTTTKSGGKVGGSSATTKSSNLAVSSPTMTVPKKLIDDTNARLKSLSLHAKELLESSQQVSTQQQANITDLTSMKSPSILTKPAVWVPAAGIATITIVVNFLFIQADRYDPRLINLGVQAAVGLVGILAIAVSYYFLKKLEAVRHITANELTLEKSLANQQLQLISDTHEALAQDLLVLTQLGVGIAKYPHTDGYITGRMELTRVVRKMEQLKELASEANLDTADSTTSSSFTTDSTTPPTTSNTTSPSSTTKPTLTNVHEVVKAISDELVQITTKQKVKLVVEEEPGLEAAITKPALTHLINASLKNAIEASPENSEVVLKISKHKTNNNQGIQIKITDKGKGIPADKLDNLFKPFSTTQSPEQFTDSGLGLDLYFSKVITEQYGGSIQLKSREGEGTTVTIRV